jgi:hypothetical protein
MQRIAAPMVGGMITAPLLSMLVIPRLIFCCGGVDCAGRPRGMSTMRRLKGSSGYRRASARRLNGRSDLLLCNNIRFPIFSLAGAPFRCYFQIIRCEFRSRKRGM